MHDCPDCGQACDCDGEDTWLEAPDDCAHECDDFDDDEVDDGEIFDRLEQAVGFHE